MPIKSVIRKSQKKTEDQQKNRKSPKVHESYKLQKTQSKPKSRVHWIPSLETEKIMIFLYVNWLNLRG